MKVETSTFIIYATPMGDGLERVAAHNKKLNYTEMLVLSEDSLSDFINDCINWEARQCQG